MEPPEGLLHPSRIAAFASPPDQPVAIERVGLPRDGVGIIGKALLARCHHDALRVRLVAVDRAELGGEVFGPADAGARHPGVQKIGPVSHRHGNLGLEGDPLLEPALGDEAPRADHVGHEVDRKFGCGGARRWRHWVLLGVRGEDRTSGGKEEHGSRCDRTSNFHLAVRTRGLYVPPPAARERCRTSARAVALAHATRQSALATVTTQNAATRADVAFYQSVLSSANARGPSQIAATAQLALHGLGVL